MPSVQLCSRATSGATCTATNTCRATVVELIIAQPIVLHEAVWVPYLGLGNRSINTLITIILRSSIGSTCRNHASRRS